MSSSYLVPNVIVRTADGERGYDIYSRLLEDRIIFLGEDVNAHTASVIVAQMLHLANEDPKADIHLYINSPGGSVSDGLAIYDTMQFITPDVATYGIGLQASMGAFLLSSGTKGKRFSLPHSRMMIHQPSSGYSGQASDVIIHAAEIERIKARLEAILAKHTGNSVEKISLDSDRDKYMNAEEAVKYGLIDAVIESV